MARLPGNRPSEDSGAGRAPIEVRVNVASGSPAKARMLWREGFTPDEIENSSINAKEVKRQEVIFEIIHTEADYVKDLRIIVDVLRGPLSNLRIAGPEQVDLIFGNIGEILELHEDINAAFMERQRQQYPVVWDISDVLLPFLPRLRIYARYICNQDNALRLVDDLKRTSNSFSVFWKERQKRPECRALPMESFLVLPFQRLLKYPLLMRTLLGSTEGWSQQFANGSLVAEQLDAWIGKIQDAQAKLDSYACIEALSHAIAGVDWAPILCEDHRLSHSGPVRAAAPVNTGRGGAPSPDHPATMWLFEDFAVIASAPTSSNGSARKSSMPLPGTQYSLVMGPCQIVEVLGLAQYNKGAPAVYLHAIPLHAESEAQKGQKTSVIVRFASRSEYTLWRGKLDAHVRRTLEQQKQPDLLADILADAIARAKIVDSGPVAQCIGSVRSPPSTGFPSANPSAMASASDIPTINVRDVYVQFPAPRHKGKLRRGWDLLCSKTEDMTGHGIKRQLKKYGGGGKRRVVESASPPVKIHRKPPRVRGSQARSSPLACAAKKPTESASSLISTPFMGSSSVPAPPPPLGQQSPSFVHISKDTVPTSVNGGRETIGYSALKQRQSQQQPPAQFPPHGEAMSGTYHPRMRGARTSAISMASSSIASRIEPSTENFVLKSYAGYSSRRSEDTIPESAQLQHDHLLSKLEFGSATLACSGGGNGEPPASSARTSFTGRSLFTMPLGAGSTAGIDIEMSDSELSTSEVSTTFPEHMAGHSGSTLFNPQPSPRHTVSQSYLQMSAPKPLSSSSSLTASRRASAVPKPLPIPPASRMPRSGFSSRKPAPVFEIGSAKLTNGGRSEPLHAGLKTWGTSAQDVLGNMPGFQASDPWHTIARQPAMAARSWQAVDADNPSSANSTESFCIVSREPQPLVHHPRRQSAERGRTQTFT